jgi:ABC-type bacteriocin/lantibiotic exporter with double-glycine peptidase domain
MNILLYLFNIFINEDKITIVLLFLLSLLNSIAQSVLISFISANIIESIKKNDNKTSIKFLYQFIFISILFLIFYYIYKTLQNEILTKLAQWMKKELLKIILLSNNEDMKHVNFIEFLTPITRISSSCYGLSFNIINNIIPLLAFLLIATIYFTYNSTILGVSFIIANICILIYLFIFWDSLVNEKSKNEIMINSNEKYIIDILNNIDKVIYRGEILNEIDNLTDKTNGVIQSSIDFLSYTTNHLITIIIFVYIVISIIIFYIIKLFYKKKINSTIFITLFSITLLYRDRMTGVIQTLPDYLESIGRILYIVDDYYKKLGNKDKLYESINKTYSPVDVEFSKIELKNVSFSYKKEDVPIFTNLNMNIKTENKIIGITGLSGKGKSTFAKLLLRLYEPTSGNIYIDGIDITTIDPIYIRKNITYVNQNSKLFNKIIIDNIRYGCSDLDQCDYHLDEIMKYDKIRQLYKNIDINNTSAGSLGENLSGGQRQVINIISGLINPSKILILDEPTNALDKELKYEVISMINYFRKYKKCIIIITHDNSVYQLFDETITI